MIRGLYTAASGMMLEQVRQDVVANNLANIETNGFKRDLARAEAYPRQQVARLGEERKGLDGSDIPKPTVLIGEMGTGAVLGGIVTIHEQGLLRETGGPTDVALTEPDLFFAVNTPDGVMYTRDGGFKINREGVLVNNSGFPVVTSVGQLKVEGTSIKIDDQGRILGQNEDGTTSELGQINVYRLETSSLEKRGDNLYAAPNQAEPLNLLQSGPVLKSGYLEGSNVNAVREMVDMIEVLRVYEMNQKLVQGEDELLDTAINKVGQV